MVTRFGRAIAHDGKGEYLVNDRVVPFAKYEEVLGSIGVLIKVRIFLVFQSDVESIARKTPKQLVEMFEVSDFWSSSCDFDDNYCLVKFSPCTLHVKRRESH